MNGTWKRPVWGKLPPISDPYYLAPGKMFNDWAGFEHMPCNGKCYLAYVHSTHRFHLSLTNGLHTFDADKPPPDNFKNMLLLLHP